MSYPVVISAQADRDLRAIYEYIAVNLLSPENAAAQLSRLEDRILKLDELPLRYPVYKKDIRIVPVDNYLVFYSFEEAKEVRVLRVMYGRQNIENKI